VGDGDGAPTWDRHNPHNTRGWHRHTPSQRIDHVFVPNAAADRMAARTATIVLREGVIETADERLPLSDHYGLLVSLARTTAPPVARVTAPARTDRLGALDK
jgi:endonuclease/exonuclease/phosphatase family metal-dependent hydrolase